MLNGQGNPVAENCVDIGSGGNWDDVTCTQINRRGALCELARCGNGIRDGALEECDGEPECDADCRIPDDVCPHDIGTTVRIFDNKCLIRLDGTYDVGNTGKNDAEAKAECIARVGPGARVVLPTTEEMNETVRTLGREISRIDLSDAASDNEFLTAAGEVPPATFFGTGEPVNRAGTDCVVAVTVGDGLWQTESCGTRRGVICEIDAEIQP